ncbi:Meckelin [Bagarius yarrelli]|uniref:Meckelin n=1 Tax=Bagarius yarrelli TaxID=175774 RepID=A0A556TM40_BAGYA|nr:Meckelin [Bagarius yarrelli]
MEDTLPAKSAPATNWYEHIPFYTQTKVPKGVTKDGYECIRCPGTIGEDGKCKCPEDSVLVERNVDGNPLEEALCELCYGTDPAFSFPDLIGDRCVRCQESFINVSQSCKCGSNTVPAGGMCFPPNSLPSTVVSIINYAQLGLAVPSAWFFNFLYSSAAACLLSGNRTACQALGNMCVMNMHSSSTVSNDACGLYNTIYRATAAQGNNQENPRINLPWLYYGEQPGLASRVLQTEPLPVGFSFKGTTKLCPDTQTRQLAAYTFGTAYKQSCVLSVSDLLAAYPEPLFYDVFIIQRNSVGDERLLAVPILNLNLQLNGQFVNQASNINSWYLTRRLIMIDSLSGRVSSLATTPKVIRVASNVKIRFQLVPNTQKGQVFPPLMTVSYSDIPITDPAKQTVAVSFSLEYEMDQNEARVKTDTVLKFLLFYAGDLGNVFFSITVATGLYWLIFYKAQQFVSVLLPLPAQEDRFVIYVSCAFALKAVQFLHELWLQISVDIFFIDWERPRSGKTSKSVEGCGEGNIQAPTVSIWRTYFVANEWNEIQTIRKINPTFQIISVLFFLEVSCSPRIAIDVYVNIIFFSVFYERFVEDKIRQFVDLCSISNVSVLLLSLRCFGYYIHGRSVHGHADTNMEEMNSNLKREAENLCGQRGLLPNSDVQTFQISITSRLRAQYDRIFEPLSRRNGPSRLIDASANPFEQNTKAYHTMNRFLASVIDHAHREMDYIVKDKLLFERVIGMEFIEPLDKSLFYNDDSYSFTELLFYGNEMTLLIFDTLFFCVVDLGSQSYILAAVLTYVQQLVFRLIRNVSLVAETWQEKLWLTKDS